MPIAASEPVRPTQLRQVFVYFGLLTLLVYLVEPTNQLMDIASAYMLKNQLHSTPEQVAFFRLATAIPVYLAFLFGLARDSWNPLGLRDRGFFLIFALLTAAVFVWMAMSPLRYAGLIASMLLVMFAFRFVAAAHQGLLALIGQEKLISGRLSALWCVISYLPQIAGAFAAGYMAENVTPRATFLMMALLAVPIAVIFGLWKPRAVFDHSYERPQARCTDFIGDIRRLVRHRAIYPAVLIMLMFQFSPGSNTVLQYYLTNELHASDAIYGYWTGIFLAAFLPVFLLYGRLCQKVPLSKLLLWGTIIAVPQMLPMVFIHSAAAALWLAIPIGMMGGIIWAAINDLAMRSCPAGLQGTLMMAVAGVNALGVRAGDLLGTWIYSQSPTKGFLICVLATMAMYALILPVLLLIPKPLLATADGQPNPLVEAAVLAEIGELEPAVAGDPAAGGGRR